MPHFFRNLKKILSLRSFGYSSTDGFTLIEFLVTIGILTVLFGIVFFNQSTYSEGASLQNLADDIGLEIAVAQSYSTSVRELVPGSGDFDTNYGVSFSLLSDPDGSPASYIIFADYDDDNRYDGSYSSCAGECLRKVDISRGNIINDLCIVRQNTIELCGVGNGVRRLDILFIRPNLQPNITVFSSPTSITSLNVLHTAVRIKLASPGGLERLVTAHFSGQVSVQ
jgi:prepilin-type N-terminal cleavage/methylation domain-containing protein